MRSNPLSSLIGLLLVVLLATGCPKGKEEFKKGKQAELEKDYDTALIHYERALKADPENTQYKLRAQRMRFEAAQMHVERGQELRNDGLLEAAAAEFEKAVAIDPSSFIAEQELRRTLDMIAARREAENEAARRARQREQQALLEGIPSAPPELKPLAPQPINLQATEDARKIFETIGRLAGVNVIFDPEFQPRRVTVDLQQATLEQALDIAALLTNSFWKPVTSNTIIVIPDSPAKRKAYEEQIIKTFFLSNTLEAAELNEIVQTLRTLLDIRRITPSTANNAIIIRDTPDKIAVAEKVIRDIDQAKPEVLIQVAILQARRDRARELGILPSSTIPLLFTPRQAIQPEGQEIDAARLDELDRVGSRDYSIVLPSATANLLLTDSTTKVIQNPEVRVTDNQTAKLRIGDRVPFATGSFQPGIGGVGVNPLVNTQFQFQDVGVNMDVTPRVHSNREVTLQVTVEVSSVTGRVNIGGIEQPIFGQRSVEHTIRLREGEVSILGGIIERSESVNITGWPGLSRVPFLRYLFSSENKDEQENEVLLVLKPRIIRLPTITAANLRPLAVGTDQNIELPRPTREETPRPGVREPEPPAEQAPELPESEPAPPDEPPAAVPENQVQGPAALRIEPAQLNLQPGQRAAVNLVVKDVRNLFSVPVVLTFDPAVVELAEVHHGGFLGGEQPAALVHRVDQEAGTAIISVSRPPGSRGVSGSGTLATLVFEAQALGQTRLTIEQVAPRDASQQPLDLQVSTGTIVVR